ncbi:MAG: hypothetical protein AABY77_05350, partial [Nitrospirota bacterium]
MVRRLFFAVSGFVVCGGLGLGALGFAHAAQASKKSKPTPALAAAQQYAGAVASGDRVAAGRLDFACQLEMVLQSVKPPASF